MNGISFCKRPSGHWHLSSFLSFIPKLFRPQDVTQCLVSPLTMGFSLWVFLAGQTLRYFSFVKYFSATMSWCKAGKLLYILQVQYIFFTVKRWYTLIQCNLASVSFFYVQNIFTDAWILDAANLADITYAHDILSARLANLVGKGGIRDISDFELVLDLTQCDNGDTKCGYYYVNNASRCLFWLDDFDARSISKIPIVSLSHLGTVFAITFCSVLFFWPILH